MTFEEYLQEHGADHMLEGDSNICGVCEVCEEEIYVGENAMELLGVKMHKSCFRQWLDDQETDEIAEKLGFTSL